MILYVMLEIEKHIQPNTVNNIYSRHFFEHLTHTQTQRTLDAWYNICVSGAEITMLVSNMNLHLWQWNNWDKLDDKQKDHCRETNRMVLINNQMKRRRKENDESERGIYINQVMIFKN